MITGGVIIQVCARDKSQSVDRCHPLVLAQPQPSLPQMVRLFDSQSLQCDARDLSVKLLGSHCDFRDILAWLVPDHETVLSLAVSNLFVSKCCSTSPNFPAFD